MNGEYEEKFKKILEEPTIRFAAMIDESGKIVSGGLKEGISMKLNSEQLNNVLKEVAIRISKRKKHDSELGRVKYSASRREDVVIMSFPVKQNAIVIVAESNINIDRTAWKVITVLGEQWGSFVGN